MANMSNALSNQATDTSFFEFTKNAKNEVTITKYKGNEKIVIIPDELDGGVVTVLSKEAFRENEDLQEVVMPDCIKTVRGGAFENCINLKKVHLSEKISAIVKNTFAGCTGLEEVNIPDNTKELKAGTFSKAPLKKLHIGESLQMIEAGSFYMGKDEPIYENGELKTYRVLKGRDTEEITIDPNNKYLKVVDSMILSSDGKMLLVMMGGEEKCIIPEGVEIIQKGAFSKQAELKEVVFPNSLKVIEETAFRETSLKSIIMPSRLKSIDKEAFLCCRELSSVTFNEGLETIGNSAFYDAPIPVVHLPSTLKQLGQRSFILFQRFDYRKFEQKVIIDPRNPYLWSDGFAIYANTENGVFLSILYHPDLMSIYNKETSWATGDRYEKHIYEVAEGTVGIGEEACSFCSGLLSIHLPDSVKYICDKAFAYSKLEKINIPKGIEVIGKDAFEGTKVREK